MSLKIVVLVKQVPDTRNVGKDAMTPEGTVNRQALPSIVNPEDLNALEMALQIKDKMPDTKITVLTMGLPSASDIVRDAIWRGADNGFLLTDRKLGGSDTLATSYAIAQAIKYIGKVDIVFSGRQAIDGDTAQVGPQTAEKLNIAQITYSEKILEFDQNSITIRRRLERGCENVKANYPLLITATNTADKCRYYNARRLMAFKNVEVESLSAEQVGCQENRIGLAGSPTKVKKIDNVVLTHKDNITIQNDDTQINDLVKQLFNTHIIG